MNATDRIALANSIARATNELNRMIKLAVENNLRVEVQQYLLDEDYGPSFPTISITVLDQLSASGAP